MNTTLNTVKLEYVDSKKNLERYFKLSVLAIAVGWRPSGVLKVPSLDLVTSSYLMQYP